MEKKQKLEKREKEVRQILENELLDKITGSGIPPEDKAKVPNK